MLNHDECVAARTSVRSYAMDLYYNYAICRPFLSDDAPAYVVDYAREARSEVAHVMIEMVEVNLKAAEVSRPLHRPSVNAIPEGRLYTMI